MTVLVLRALGLGDFLTGLPALQLLRSAFPAERIVLAAPRWFAPLAALAGTVDEVVHAHELAPLVDAPRHAELAIDLHGNAAPSQDLLVATAPRRLLAFNRDGGPRWWQDEHEVARWCRLLIEGLPLPGAVPPSVVGSLPVPDGRPPVGGATVVHCGAKAAARRWPAERFAAVAMLLRAAGHDVVVTGGTAERELATAIGAAAGVPVLADLSLLDLLRLVAAARLVVSGDTGVGHAATNYAVPSVLLFGPVAPHAWGPPADARHQVLWHGTGDGDPHGDRLDPALAKITVAEVLAGADRALEAIRRAA